MCQARVGIQGVQPEFQIELLRLLRKGDPKSSN